MERMNQNFIEKKKRSFISDAFKFFIAAASITGTVALWGVFSKKDAQVTQNPVVDDPMPTLVTLVPLNDVASAPLSTGDSTLSSLPVVQQQIAPSYSNSNIQVIQPAPVTTTKSSG
jgi:hypothetical protein